MAQITYQTLLQSRCDSNGKPVFWKPQPIKAEPFTLLTSNQDKVLENWGCETTISRIIALSLFLELPVGDWVGEFTKSDSEKVSKEAYKLLKTNQNDEAGHYKGFSYASEAYPISSEIMQEAEHIGKLWESSNSHVLERAALAETGVLLAGLGILRLCGGKGLRELATQISRDENRHVTTNRSIIRDLGYNPQKPTKRLLELVLDTLDWVYSGFNIPGSYFAEFFNIDKDFIITASKDIIETGINEMFDDLLNVGYANSPFEISNMHLY